MLNGWFRFNMVAALALAVHAIASTASLAQQWPTHPVRFVLPFGPGSGADTAARLITEKLQQKWGQPVIIDGKPGGDGLLSLGTVVSAKDDHTLFFGPSSIFVVQRYVHENMTFDPETDLVPIAGVAKVQIAVAVPTSLGISTLAEFVALARAKPSTTSYAVAPGFFSTPLAASWLNDPQNYKSIMDSTPLRRVGAAEDIMGVVTFLASEASNLITGQTISIDGGRTVL